jgi:hypothetical protein
MPERVRITVFDPHGAQVAAPGRALARQLGPQEVVVELPRLRGQEIRRHLSLGHPRRRRLGREAQRRDRERQARSRSRNTSRPSARSIGAIFEKRFASREEIVKTLGGERFKAGAKGAVRALPDGLADTDLSLEDFGDLLRADRVALLATTEPIATMRVEQEGMQKIWTSSPRLGAHPD